MDTRGLGRTSDACASLSRGTRGRLRCRRSRGRCGGQVLMMVVLLLMMVVLLASWPCALIYSSVGGMSVSRLSRLPARTCLMRMACTCLGALDRHVHASSIHGMYVSRLCWRHGHVVTCTCLMYTYTRGMYAFRRRKFHVASAVVAEQAASDQQRRRESVGVPGGSKYL